MILKKEIFKGVPVYPGLFYGKILLIQPFKNVFQPEYITEESISKETIKFQKSLTQTKKDLVQIFNLQKENFGESDNLDIIETQIIMLDDPLLKDGVIQRVREHKESAKTALYNIIQKLSDQFMGIQNEFFRERVDHILDIHDKLEDHLNDNSELNYFKTKIAELKEDVILVMPEISPSFMLALDRTHIRAIATDMGGKTGHMAILSRNYGIPTIVGLKVFSSHVKDNDMVFFDGEKGAITLNPEQEEILYYNIISSFVYKEKETIIKTAITKDGVSLKVRGNLESEADCETALKFGVDGIGLFRSEILFMKNPHHIPDVEEQFQLYKNILVGMKNKRVVIRTFDIGADKLDHIFEEENPFLGNRGIRYTLQNRTLFESQLTAILRASEYGRVAILLPMVNSITEIRKTKELLEECKSKLKKQNIPFKSNIKIGIMVETPAAALSLDVFAEECDFFSLGTNDLLQYTSAVDRNNIYVSELYNPYHISFLRIIKKCVETADKHDTPISICGEIASDMNFILLLMGLGLRDFSVALPFVSEIKKLICSVDIAMTKKLARKVMQLAAGENYSAIEAYLFNRHLVEKN